MYEPVIHIGAVVVSALVFFAWGALWYGPLFGKVWMKAMGWTKEILEADKTGSSMAVSYGLMFMASLIMAWVTAHMVDFMFQIYGDLTPLAIGLSNRFWLWLGYVFAYLITAPAFEKKPWSYVAVNGGYWFIGIVTASLINAYWR